MGLDIDGDPFTREQAWKEATRICPTHHGLLLNRDGKTFKVRVPNKKEVESWKTPYDKKPPATKMWMIERAPTVVPVEAVPEIPKETIGWEVEQPRRRFRGKGEHPTRRITVKASDCRPVIQSR